MPMNELEKTDDREQRVQREAHKAESEDGRK